jgi:5-methyltetrahydropteroyltriglutamate--homocysteine methyltransferase
MKRSVDRVLTTHVGSLVRTGELRSLLEASRDGKDVSQAQFESTLRLAVKEVVRRQVEAGIDVVDDGEFGKGVSWSRYAYERLDGFERVVTTPGGSRETLYRFGERFADFQREYTVTEGFENIGFKCVGPVRYAGWEALQRDIGNLKAALEGSGATEAFMPVVAPASLVRLGKGEYYDTQEEFVAAVSDAMREEYETIVRAGFILQVDDAWLPMEAMNGVTDAYVRWANMCIEALNHALAPIPEDRVRYHICWGSQNSPHITDVPFRDIAHLVLSVKAGAYSIEMANPRHEHEWRVWESVKLPEGKLLVPGVISHATNIVEHPELVAERIVRLAKLVGREHIIASTDCGFAQGPLVRRVHHEIQWAKLEALAEGARLATKELW